MSLQHILKPLGAAAAFALALYTVLVPHGAVSAPESALSAVSERPRAPMMDTIDNSRECDHAANVRERCIYN